MASLLTPQNPGFEARCGRSGRDAREVREVGCQPARPISPAPSPQPLPLSVTQTLVPRPVTLSQGKSHKLTLGKTRPRREPPHLPPVLSIIQGDSFNHTSPSNSSRNGPSIYQLVDAFFSTSGTG